MDYEHSSLTPERFKWLQSQKPLTVIDLLSLKLGEKVIVLWTGGNGPHIYKIVEEGDTPSVAILEWNGNPYGMHELNFVGENQPFTRVWKYKHKIQ